MKTSDKFTGAVRIRPATESDVAFIFSTWLRSYRDSNFASGISTTVYYAEHHKVVERLLKSSDVFVACSEADISELFGFICAQQKDGILVLHYIYVKHSFRQLGIGTQLLNIVNPDTSKTAIYTHMTRISRTLATKFGFVHSPYLALTAEYQKDKATKLSKADKEKIYGGDAQETTDDFALRHK